MNDAYKKLFNGFLLVMLDISIGSFDILPDVIGYILVFSGLAELYSKTEEGSFGLAKLFSLWMILSGIYELLTVTFGFIHLSAFSSYAVMLLGGLGELILVIVIYQGMTAHMGILNENKLSQRFSNENKRYILIQGATLIVMSFSLNIPKNISSVFMIVLLVISIIMHIRLLINLDIVKKLFDEESEVIGA